MGSRALDQKCDSPDPIVAGGADVSLPGSGAASEALLNALHVEVNDWRDVEREKLRDEQAADDGEAERAAGFGAGTSRPPGADFTATDIEKRGHY